MSAEKYLTKACPHCGSGVSSINPKWLREMRVSKGISLRRVSEKLGISAPYLSDIELGRRNVPEYVLNYYENPDLL